MERLCYHYIKLTVNFSFIAEPDMKLCLNGLSVVHHVQDGGLQSTKRLKKLVYNVTVSLKSVISLRQVSVKLKIICVAMCSLV